MTDPISPREERRLAEYLRHEAEAERPAFSEALHRRIVAALPAPEAAPRPGNTRRPGPRLWLAAAVAAGVAVAAVLLVSQVLDRDMPGPPAPDGTAVLPRGETPPEDTPREKAPDENPGRETVPFPGPHDEPQGETNGELDPLGAVAGGTAANVDRLVDATLARSKWAYLDHDARLAANLMLAQIPLDLDLWEDEIDQ